MKEIAIYGKGGIGKSTLSANISAALALQGERILQIGCDPKHDSTRLLMNGKRITTVLDYIRKVNPMDYRLNDILFSGFAQIGCIEAGGPEPGVGCAGRGIITAFELLDKFNIKENYDILLYDVLGDVVCGGFAVPIRREYADTIFLVTSGEYMSLYAANNILRGIKNYDGEKCRVAGILFNSRNVKDEDRRVNAFANAVGLPVFAKIPRDNIFAQAERQNCTVPQLTSQESKPIANVFATIAEKILAGPPLYPARPLRDEDLEALIFSRIKTMPSSESSDKQISAAPVSDNASIQAYNPGYLSKNVIRSEPLHGCAFNGAMTMSIHLRDAVIIAHSPKSCTYLSYQSISSSGRRQLFERGSLLPVSLSPNLLSTDMDESDMVFGGTDKLFAAIEQVKQLSPRPKAAIIISSCPSGIIGDDIDQAKTLSEPDFPVITIKADGNLTGDYLQGMLTAYTQLAKQIIDPKVKPQEGIVNIVFEKVVAKNTESNFLLMKDYLTQLGIQVNCRFLCDTTFDELKNFCSAKLNLLAYHDYTGTILKNFFTKEYGCRFYENQFPVGFAETETWLSDIGTFFGKAREAADIIAENEKLYRQRIQAVRPVLTGKRLLIITYNHNLDWILQAALDAGMEIVKLCILNFSQDEGFRTAIPQAMDILREEDYDKSKRENDIRKHRPDIVLSNYESSVIYENCIADTLPMCPDNGFFSGLLMLERWVGLFTDQLEGEWKNDQYLFDKYYTR
ncbi:MAG: nitrogenase component 1 [Emergencia sp.]|nr:nitrogenase component 1 [Emergencia sp.]